VTRPDRDVVLRLLAAAGRDVTLTEHDLIEDVDGIPAGVTTTTTSGVLVVSPELLGWTRAELGLDEDDE
jgi:hypothetical protein